jgi:phage/plasmid-like protein (TIGR03299 family)
MSHEMYENDTAMYANGEAAWHGLGTVVEHSPSPAEALRLSGLDWKVVKSPSIIAEYWDENGNMEDAISTKNVATIRQDTGDILGLVSPSYQVVQNEELFDIAYELGADVRVETAGSLDNNKKIYIMLRGDTFDVGSENDSVTQYLGLFNSFNGTLSLSGLPTSIRVVCANTLNMALSQGGRNLYRIKHTGEMTEKIADLRRALKRFRETGSLFQDKVEMLNSKFMNTSDIQNFWVRVYTELQEPFTANPTTEKEERATVKAAQTIAEWSQVFDLERSEHNLKPTAWVAANAVTNWLQHREGSRGRKMSANSRVHNNLIGKAADSSSQVMKMALAV